MRSLNEDTGRGERTLLGGIPGAAAAGPGYRVVVNAAGDYTVFYDKPFKTTAPAVEVTPFTTVGGTSIRVSENDQFHFRVVNNAGASNFSANFIVRGL